MWGNTLGWILSLLLVVATAGGVGWLKHHVEAISPRTAFSGDARNGAVIALPVSPDVVAATFSSAPASDADGGEFYRQALDQFNQQAATYLKFARIGKAGDIENIPAINLLVQARTANRAAIFTGHLTQIINYDGDHPALEALVTLGQCARRAGQLIQPDAAPRARQLYEAEFSLGERLYDERLTYAELDAGLTLMAEGSGMLQQLGQAVQPVPADLAAEIQAAHEFDAARRPYVTERITPVWNIIGSVDQSIVEQSAGDMFYFSDHAADRMWRVEAILKLGRYRFNAGRVGDQRSAARTLDQLKIDADPAIRAAATAARNLTVEQYRMIK